MHTQPNPRITRVFKKFSQGAGLLATLVGAAVLAGWAGEVSALKSVFRGLATMKANTALDILLAGLALWLAAARPRQRAAYLCTGIVVAISFLTILEYLLKVDWGIDQLLFRDDSLIYPGRMSLSTAITTLLLGIALLLLDAKVEWISPLLAFLALWISSFAIAGYIASVEELYSFLPYSSMAIHTAATLMALSLGLLAARPERRTIAVIASDSVGGMMMRRLLPASVVILLAITFLRVMGERAGLYGTRFGIAFLATSSIFTVILLIWSNARWLHRMDLDRKAAIQAVRDSERHFRALIENSSDAIALIDANGTIIYASPSTTRILGYAVGEFVSHSGFDFVHPDDVESARQKFAELMEAPGKTVMLQTHARHKDGTWRWIESVSTNLLDEPGVRAIVANFRDITDRKIAEQTLRESEKRLQTVTENLSEGLVISNLDGQLLHWNRAALEMHGYRSLDECLLKLPEFIKIFELSTLDGSVLKFEQWPMPRIFCGEPLRDLELRIRRLDSDWERVFSYGGAIVHDASGKPLAFLTITDITERKRAEEALRESVAFNQIILQTIPFGIDIVDQEGNLLFINPSLEAIAGKGGLGQKCWKFYKDNQQQCSNCPLRRNIVPGETCIIESDGVLGGRVFQISHTGMLFQGKPAMLEIFQDITERKQVEERLQAYAVKLERSNRELQDFASVASHDLQEPLRKIQAFGDRLKKKCGESLDEQARDYLERMQNAAQRMQTLINDLLTFSRVTTKAQPFLPTNLTEVTREVLSDLGITIEELGAQVEVSDLPVIEVDRLQIRQLLQNLISNALKFHRQQVAPVVKILGKLSAVAPGRDSADEHDADEAYCQLFVEDNGIGFDEKYLDRIFNLFQRLHGRNEYEGTGIGLAVCRKIVERHGGRITASSKPGEGATFIVTLPVKHSSAPYLMNSIEADSAPAPLSYQKTDAGRGRGKEKINHE